MDEVRTLTARTAPERVTCQKCFSLILPSLGCMCKLETESESRIDIMQCTSQPDDGIMYQRCGGGRRIIKKRIGGD